MESFEQTLRETTPVLLAVPGLLLMLSGLFLWPAGLRLLKPLAAFFAAGVGLVCAWMFTDRSLVPMLLLGLLPALVALFLDKPIIVLLGATLAGVGVLMVPVVADASVREAAAENAPVFPSAEEASILEMPAYVEQLAGWTTGWLGALWAAIPDLIKAAAAGMMILVLIVGVAAWRWVCALTCAALGTAMLLSGLALLILSKGPQTIPYIEDKYPYLWPLAGSMVVAGTLLNRWLCPYVPKPKKRTERQSDQGVEK